MMQTDDADSDTVVTERCDDCPTEIGCMVSEEALMTLSVDTSCGLLVVCAVVARCFAAAVGAIYEPFCFLSRAVGLSFLFFNFIFAIFSLACGPLTTFQPSAEGAEFPHLGELPALEVSCVTGVTGGG